MASVSPFAVSFVFFAVSFVFRAAVPKLGSVEPFGSADYLTICRTEPGGFVCEHLS